MKNMCTLKRNMEKQNNKISYMGILILPNHVKNIEKLQALYFIPVNHSKMLFEEDEGSNGMWSTPNH